MLMLMLMLMLILVLLALFSCGYIFAGSFCGVFVSCW